ncbi:MAG: hypothetical protein NTZ40_08900 [Cyanobacteria bacterium]|nr:hypothetical protein [Cyanobacteriota bacterium]
MREISPALHMSCEEFLAISPNARAHAERIRAQKLAGIRPVPSPSLLDYSTVLQPVIRANLIDKVASLVDENLFGRSEMCHQFAILVSRALSNLGLNAKTIAGTAMYYENGCEIFRWKHYWVRCGAEIIDGNSDILFENPKVPKNIIAPPYWGPVKLIPPERRLRPSNEIVAPDPDVDNIWWNELDIWLNGQSGPR